MLLFRFRQSRSPDFPWVLDLAQRGAFIERALTPKQSVYESSFDLTQAEQLAHAIALAHVLTSHKTAEAFYHGQPLTLRRVHAVLCCYQQSRQLDHWQAFCWTPIRIHSSHTFPQDLRTWLFPCHLAHTHAPLIHVQNPMSLWDQTAAALVKAQTHWCPRLADQSDWRVCQQVQMVIDI